VKRDPELRPLSEHHHHVLVWALEIRRTAESGGADRDERLRKLGESFVRFWDESGHEDPEITRMLAEHATIRAAAEDVKESLGGRFASEPLVELGRMLHDHVRLEEDHIFPRIEKALSEAELHAVGARLTHLHGDKR